MAVANVCYHMNDENPGSKLPPHIMHCMDITSSHALHRYDLLTCTASISPPHMHCMDITSSHGILPTQMHCMDITSSPDELCDLCVISV